MDAPGEIIDARGLKCPLPVLKLEKHLDAIEGGAAVTVLADDPVARVDIPLLCRKGGHSCEIERVGEALRFVVTKSG